MSDFPRVGVLGARSLVGRALVPHVARRPGGVLAVSRAAVVQDRRAGVAWCRPGDPRPAGAPAVTDWVSLCPLWVLPEHVAWLERVGIRRLVALSSTSIDTKADSPDAAERWLADRLAAAERRAAAWAAAHGVLLTILRPTMIYDGRHDRTVATVAAVVRRMGWFPLCGAATGLRQPVHAGDVAAACLAAIDHDPPRRCYAIAGAETLTFRDLVERTCRAHGLPARTVSLPPWLWNTCASLARWTWITAAPLAGMGRRMNEDLSCDHAVAAADLGYRPRPFTPGVGTLDDEAAAPAERSEQLQDER